MLEKGYASAAQAASDEQTGLRLQESLRAMELSLENFQRFTAPKEVMSLQGQVIGAQATLGFQSIRLRREEERLAHYQEPCRPLRRSRPHGGIVIYANRPGREPRVYLGASGEGADAPLHAPGPVENGSRGPAPRDRRRSHPHGMAARVHVEALPGPALQGRVEAITRCRSRTRIPTRRTRSPTSPPTSDSRPFHPASGPA